MINKTLLSNLIVITSILFSSCGESGGEGSSNILDEDLESTEPFAEDGNYRLSSMSSYSDTLGGSLWNVQGNLIQEITFSSGKYTITQYGIALLSYGDIEITIGCSQNKTGWTKWEFELDNQNMVKSTQKLNSTCESASNTGIDSTDITLKVIEESWKKITDGYERLVVAELNGEVVNYNYVFQKTEVEVTQDRPEVDEANQTDEIGSDNSDNVEEVQEVVVSLKEVYSSGSAFALLWTDGSVTTMGSSKSGDSSSVADKLTSGVVEIYSNGAAFVAIKTNGSLVAWGDPDNGGDISAVPATKNINVKSVHHNYYSFAAIKYDGSVFTWGSPTKGANIDSVASQLSSGVTHIVSNQSDSYVALKSDGSIVSWGERKISDVNSFNNVEKIYGGRCGFVTIDKDTIFYAALYSSTFYDCWDVVVEAVDSSNFGSIANVFETTYGFVLVKLDGSVVSIGDGGWGNDITDVKSELTEGVASIYSVLGANAALKSDGSVVTWGGINADSSSVSSYLTGNVAKVATTDYAFAALKSDGSVITWGNADNGGDSSSVSIFLESGVIDVVSTGGAFAAIKEDGSVITWGSETKGGDSTSVAGKLSSNIKSLFSNGCAFLAISESDELITWGCL